MVYEITVTDSNNCSITLDFEEDSEISENEAIEITEPETLAISESHENVLCNGDFNGSIDIIVIRYG